MYIYSVKLNWFNYAKNECITVVVPGGFALNDPISAFWQWTVDANGNKKRNTCQNGIISSVTKTTNKLYQFDVSFGYYNFNCTLSHDFHSLTVDMRNPSNEHDPSGATTLQLQTSDPVTVPTATVYTGKLNWYKYAREEMVALVVPTGVSEGAKVGIYYQWTIDASGKEKTNNAITSTFRNVKSGQDGTVTGFTDNGYYTFDITIKPSSKECILGMTNPSGEHDSHAPYHLKQTDFRSTGVKKALIIRFNTGVDNGIFLVRDMLTQHLAFSQDDIEMLYYDSDPLNKLPKLCTSGQNPPTVSNFKARFTNLLSSASPGSVRFVYVDTHGTTYEDEDKSGEADQNDEGWILAQTEDGALKEVVSDDWVAETIKNHLGADVNLTILTSSCMGGGMLDTHTATRGILLAGCHETQSNVKALKGMDPWMYAVVNTVKKHFKSNRGVPTYSVLFNEAKRFITKQISDGQISVSCKYKGPSPDELHPLPRDSVTDTSHQDPQLIFYNGYVDPDVERFLYPFEAAYKEEPSGDATRFPKDEDIGHDEL